MEQQEYSHLKTQINQRLNDVRTEINQILSDCSRPSDSVTLIGVSKFFPAEYAKAACELGLTDLGENRVQELLSKQVLLEQENLHPNWHLIGSLQTNKVKLIVGHAHLIHSVSSLELLLAIQKQSMMLGLVTPILLQVNVAEEESKHGFKVDQLDRAVDLAGQCQSIRLDGLMTMAPKQTYPHEAKPVFERTRELFLAFKDQVRQPECWNSLSMGMSQDYTDAILCGATHIRVGTAIFGKRSV